jgi:hypothetical protein
MTAKERYKTDPVYRERIQRRNRERYQNNKEYRERNKEKLRERRACPEYTKRERQIKAAYSRRPEIRAAKAASGGKRRAAVRENIKLTPEQQEELKSIYYHSSAINEAARGAGAENMAKAVGVKYAFAVDHIMPLRPNKVEFNGKLRRPYIGLHAPWNLQIIDALDNLSKRNKD